MASAKSVIGKGKAEQDKTAHDPLQPVVVTMTFSGKKAEVPEDMRAPGVQYLHPTQFSASISPALSAGGL